MNFQKPRGTNDLFFESIDKLNYVVNILKQQAELYLFKQIETPMFEHLELFTKNIGESTDIVQKEIYSFTDKSDRQLALRPEGTAGVIRAYVENKIYGNKNTATKFYYISKLFRYERPQNGRYREFHQFGIEYLGTNSFFDLVECIVFADTILKRFGLKNQYVLKINNIGDFKEREKWIIDLKEYFINHKDELSELSISRIETNPLRIIDDKEDSKKEVVKNAPKIIDYLTAQQKDSFLKLQSFLSKLGIKFEIDDNLVRGLDYYTNVVFEFVSTSELISKTTIIGGGEYKELIKQTGGPDQKGIGFAIGLERLIKILEEEQLINLQDNKIEYLIASKYENTELPILEMCSTIRNLNIKADMLLDERKPNKINKYVNSNNIQNIIWIQENTHINKKIILENVSSNTKQEIEIEKLINNILITSCKED